MAESIDPSTNKIEHDGIGEQRDLTYSTLNGGDALLGVQVNESYLQERTSSDSPAEHVTFRTQKQLHKANEENSSESPHQKSAIHRLSALISKSILSTGVITKGHKRARSESVLPTSNSQQPGYRFMVRRTHSAIDHSRLDLQKGQQRDQNENTESMQSHWFERIKQRIKSHPYDRDWLQDHLMEALIGGHTSRDPHGQFLPKGALNNLVTQESVIHELSQWSKWEYLPTKITHRTWRPATIDTYVRIELRVQIAQTGSLHGAMPHPNEACFQKIFAILLFMRRAKKIWYFVEEGVSDADLPLSQMNLDGVFELRRGENGDIPLRCLKRPSDISAFVMHQWLVLAPFFGDQDDEKVPHYKCWKHQILPFLVYPKHTSRWGGSGEVHNDVVAVKRISINNRTAFDSESNVLRNLHKKRHAHRHLITLLATYEQDDHLYLILPWAEMDLDHYWRSDCHRPSSNKKEISTWLKQQCCGIAEAVSQIHRYNTSSETSMLHEGNMPQQNHPSDRCSGQGNPKKLFGRHGDIKPANILWFPDQTPANGRGILKLSDFGTARFSDNKKVSVRDRTTLPNSIPYRSPECQLPNGEISSQCDVWSLGCVFLEFVCWYFGGRDRLEKFERDRAVNYGDSSFFVMKGTSDSTHVKLKHPVQKMIATLQEESVSNGDLLDVLRAVSDDMLLILDNSTDSSVISHSTGISTSPNFLGVTQQAKRRRKSVGNIARALGSVLPF